MVELEIRKFGNWLGVVLPKEVRNRLQTGDGKRIFLIEAADRDYWFTPEHPAFEKKFRSRSRDHDCSQPPPRIRTSGFPASGSCLR